MIVVGSDHGGFALKQEIIEFLKQGGYEDQDVGIYQETTADYPDIAQKAAEMILCGEADKGILICGTGIGISITANRYAGIRAALCHDCFSAEATRLHNDANVLAMGGRVIGSELAKKITHTFLTTPFSEEERHKRRIEKTCFGQMLTERLRFAAWLAPKAIEYFEVWRAGKIRNCENRAETHSNKVAGYDWPAAWIKRQKEIT